MCGFKRCRLNRVGHSIPMHYDTQHLAPASLVNMQIIHCFDIANSSYNLQLVL